MCRSRTGAGRRSEARSRWLGRRGARIIVGTFDGEVFTVATVGPFETVDEPETYVYENPRPGPEGGWVVPDPEHNTQEDVRPAGAYARAQPDYAISWVDHPDEELQEFSPVVFIAVFTGDAGRHEAGDPQGAERPALRRGARCSDRPKASEDPQGGRGASSGARPSFSGPARVGSRRRSNIEVVVDVDGRAQALRLTRSNGAQIFRSPGAPAGRRVSAGRAAAQSLSAGAEVEPTRGRPSFVGRGRGRRARSRARSRVSQSLRLRHVALEPRPGRVHGRAGRLRRGSLRRRAARTIASSTGSSPSDGRRCRPSRPRGVQRGRSTPVSQGSSRHPGRDPHRAEPRRLGRLQRLRLQRGPLQPGPNRGGRSSHSSSRNGRTAIFLVRPDLGAAGPRTRRERRGAVSLPSRR